MTSATLSALLVLFATCTPALAQSADTQQVQFNQVLNVNGDMKINSFQFPDRSRVETFSQKQQQIIVNQQQPAIPANQVTGTTGQPFVAISPQSMTISTNGASDLVGGQILMAMTMQNLQAAAVQPDNTYVAMLSPDRQTWMIQESMRSVNSTDMTVRMVKRNQLDGEYMVVGRQTVETNTLVQPFGSAVAIQGTGLQENEFQDGFRMATRATQPMTMNVDVVDGIDSSMLAGLQGMDSVNDYRYKVTTNLGAVTPNLNNQITVVQMPINALRIQKMMQAMGVPPNGQVAIGVAQRAVLQNPGGATGNLGGAAAAGGLAARHIGRSMFRRQILGQTGATLAQGQTGAALPQGQVGTTPPQGQAITPPQVGTTLPPQNQAGTPTLTNNTPNPVAQQLLLAPTFTPIQATAVLDQTNMRVAIPVQQVDGEYILTMVKMGAGQQPAAGLAPEGAAAPAQGAAPPSAELSPLNSTLTRRQSSPNTAAPKGSVIMTMKMIDDMAEVVKWGGQAPVSRMMSEFYREVTGRDMPGLNGTLAGAGVKIVV